MIIVKIRMGLGNQMFQYAMAKSLSISLQRKLYIDTSFFQNNRHRDFELIHFTNINDRQIIFNKRTESKLFKIKSILKTLNGKNENVVKENYIEPYQYFNFYNDLYSEDNDIFYLQGYFQSEKYFKINKSEIKMLFFRTLPDIYSELRKKIETSESVSIHFRKGDYITNPQAKAFYINCGMDYYIRAIRFIQKKTSKIISLFIFSDDIEWVKRYFPNYLNLEITFIDNIEGKDSTTDMVLMSKCKHNIIANSTYSWWGAWLNDNNKKIVCSPEKWFYQHPMGDLLPKNWYRF